jgi:tRNA-dihydrouridine synthase B
MNTMMMTRMTMGIPTEIKIGDIRTGVLFMAPMSNVTNLPFRLMCKRYGASMLYSEMINADAYLMESEKTGRRAFFLDEERPIGVQMFGSDEDHLCRAAKKIEHDLRPDIIDINIGCPAYAVMKTGAGARLLNDVKRVESLVKKMVHAIKAPLTCKIRILDEKETLVMAKAIEKAGAKALTVHGRTPRQRYSGRADWDMIRKVKENLRIPVILNGDVVDEDSAADAFDKTGCDAIMVGRAAVGNPFLFKRLSHFLAISERLRKQTLKECAADFLEYLDLCEKHGYTSVSAVKMQAQNFVKGFSGVKKHRVAIVACKDIGGIRRYFLSLNKN